MHDLYHLPFTKQLQMDHDFNIRHYALKPIEEKIRVHFNIETQVRTSQIGLW